MNIENVPTSSLIEYALNNVTHSEKQVERLASSIKEFGFNVPLLVNSENVLIAGHGRLMAAKKLGLATVPVIRLEHLSPAQEKAWRILDNKLARESDWDLGNLELELEFLKESDFDVEGWGLDSFENTLTKSEDLQSENKTESNYTFKIETPIYKPQKSEPPTLANLFNKDKASILIEAISSTDLAPDLKEFLKIAAYRHVKFNYQNIAEFYSHAPANVQKIMEDSALVIIDFNDAIANGYVKLTKELMEKIEGKTLDVEHHPN